MTATNLGKSTSRPQRRALALVTAVLVSAVLAGRADAQEARKPQHPFEFYHYHAIDDRLSTSGQITEDEIGDLAELGFAMVINLAVADAERNGSEGFLVAQQGLAYSNIPVDWNNPTLDDLLLFFDIMDARGDRRTLVHCFANYRASSFTYLYRTVRLGVADAVARRDLNALWTPEVRLRYPQWIHFIESARATLTGEPQVAEPSRAPGQ